MKKIKLLRYCIIAAGIVISAAFYIVSGASDADYSLYVGTDAEQAGTLDEASRRKLSDDGVSLSDDAGNDERFFADADPGNDVSGAAAFTADGVMTGISEEFKAELRSVIKAAVREELVSICDDGYLETALDKAAEYSAGEAERRKGLVNINTADRQELMTLAGIGEKRADDIIAYRQQHGNFAEPSDIMKVSGIKASLFEKIRDKICI